MSEEDEKLQKHLIDEMMKVSKTNPDVMIYMSILMKKYEELEEELEKYKSIIKEVREWAKKCSCQFTNDDEELVVSEISFNIQARPCDLFKILDKVDKEKE